MRGATFLLAAAVLVGLVTTSVRAADPHSGRFGDDRISVHAVGHPGTHHRHYGYSQPWAGGRGPAHGYHYSARPYVVRPPIIYPPVVVPYSIYPGCPHVCGPQCGPRCRYAYPYNNFYYRGSGWGFSLGF